MKKLLLLAFLLLCFAGKAEAREEWYGFCQAQSSSARVASCTVEVFLAGTNTDATLYSDNAGTLIGNPFTAPLNGIITFYADNGRYDVRLSGGNPSISPAYTIPDQLLVDFSISAPDGSSLFSLSGSIGGISIGGNFIGVDNSVTPTQFSMPLPFVTNSQITSTLATGTAPLNVTSTTLNPNLNVALLQGASWANPPPIGSTTPSSGVFTSLTSATANPAIGAFLDLANTDNLCWRNVANTLNECLSATGDVFSLNNQTIAFTTVSQNWTQTQNFSNITWNSGGLNIGILSHSNTGARTYTFQDVTGTIAELNPAQTFLGLQTFSGGISLGEVNPLTGVSGNTATLATTGTVNPSAAIACTDASGNFTNSGCPAASIQSVTTKNLASPASLVANTLKQIDSVALTMPSSGCPCRVLINYSYANHAPGGGSTPGTIVFYVSDGTNKYAMSEVSVSSVSDGQANSGSGVSASFANSATPTFTVQAKSDQAQTIDISDLVSASTASGIQLTILTSN